MRKGEAKGLEWPELDLKKGLVSLDENKTDRPRSWVLSHVRRQGRALDHGPYGHTSLRMLRTYEERTEVCPPPPHATRRLDDEQATRDVRITNGLE
jgi:integrase